MVGDCFGLIDSDNENKWCMTQIPNPISTQKSIYYKINKHSPLISISTFIFHFNWLIEVGTASIFQFHTICPNLFLSKLTHTLCGGKGWCIYYRADKSTLSGAFVVTGEKPRHARTIIFIIILVSPHRPAQLAELSRSEFDSELFSHSAYVKFFVIEGRK